MSLKRGYFVAKNSKGTVAFKGLATITNDAVSARHADISEVSEHRDAGNITRAWTIDMYVFEIALRLTMGVGSNFTTKADLIAAIATLKKFDQIITASFEDADFNWADAKKGVIWDVGKTLEQGNLLSVDVTCRRWVEITESGGTITETALDYTGGWKQI